MIALSASLLLAGLCQPTPVDTEVPPRDKPVDAGTPADCAAACAHLAELGCEEAQNTPPTPREPQGLTCTQLCERFEASGVVTLNPACVATIASCAEIETKCSYGQPR